MTPRDKAIKALKELLESLDGTGYQSRATVSLELIRQIPAKLGRRSVSG